MLKKIYLYYPSFEKGGATKNLINLTNFFIKKKIKVILFSFNAKKKYFNKNEFLKIINCNPQKKFSFFPIRWNLALSSMLSLIKECKNSKKDTIIFSMQSHIPAILVALLFKKKIVIRNSEEPLGATKYADNKILAFIVLFLKFVFYNFADKIIAISKKSEKSLQSIVFKKEKISLILNPYLKKKFKNKRTRKSKKKKFNILYAGRITYQKNLFPLVNSCISLIEKNLNIHLTIVGNGNLKEKLQKKVKKFSNIRIVNWQNNLENEYLKSDLFVLNSFYEGLPNVLIDAVNYGIPCISSDVSGARDILLNGRGGYIIPINDRENLEKKILYVINNYDNAKKKALIAKSQIYKLGKNNLELFYKTFLKLVNY